MATTIMNRFSGFVAAVAGLALAASTPAAAITWSGGVSNDFADGGNWVGGVAPANNNYQDTANFAGMVTSNTPTISGNRDMLGLSFQSAGWTLAGSGTTILRSVSSYGVGTNTVTQKLKTYQTSTVNTWTVGAGNILNLTAAPYIDGSSKTLKITGGGEIVSSHAFEGYSTGNIVRIDDATVRVASASPYLKDGVSRQGYTWIDSTSSVLELKTTVADANSMIANAGNKGSINDGTGFGLSVTDIGGGYVQIAAVPEPATVGLLAIGGLTLLARRRRA